MNVGIKKRIQKEQRTLTLILALMLISSKYNEIGKLNLLCPFFGMFH